MSKLWNPITIAVVVGISLGLFWAAVEGDFPPFLKAGVVKQGRISMVEHRGYAPALYIVDVDGVEYLVNPNGGVVPLVKGTP